MVHQILGLAFAACCFAQSPLMTMGAGYPLSSSGPPVPRSSSINSQYADGLSGTTVLSPAMPLAVGAGHALIGFLWYETVGAPATSVTTSGSDTCVLVAGSVQATSVFTQELFYCLAVAGGSSYTVTGHLTGSSPFSAIYVAEYVGVNAFDKAAANTASSAALSLGSALTPTAGNELVFSAGIIYGCNGCAAATVGNNLPRFITWPYSDTVIADQVQGAATGVTNFFTTTSAEWGLSVAAFTTTASFSLPTPYIESSTSYLNATAATSHTTPAFNTTGATHLLLVIGTHNPWNLLPITVTGLSDTAGNTWTLLAGPTVFVGANFPLDGIVYYVSAPITNTADTITVTLSNPVPVVMYAAAIANSSGTPVASAINSPLAGMTSTAVSSGPLASSANSLLVQFAKNENQFIPSSYYITTSGFSLDAGQFANQGGTAGPFMFASWQFQTSSGSYSGNWTYTQANGWQSAIIAFHK